VSAACNAAALQLPLTCLGSDAAASYTCAFSTADLSAAITVTAAGTPTVDTYYLRIADDTVTPNTMQVLCAERIFDARNESESVTVCGCLMCAVSVVRGSVRGGVQRSHHANDCARLRSADSGVSVRDRSHCSRRVDGGGGRGPGGVHHCCTNREVRAPSVAALFDGVCGYAHVRE
jgi:hypothetical protein